MTTKGSIVGTVSAALMLMSAVGGAAPAAAQPPAPREERVTFARGATSATIRGQLKGHEDVDYLVRAGAGQTITVSLQRSNTSNGFNVISPGNTNVAMYVGDTSEAYTAMLPTDGDYRIRLYLGRAAARRPNASSTYTLTVTVTGKARAPLPKAQDALLPGTPFHASASITCVALPYLDTKPKPCQAFVIRREGEATATVEIPLDAESRRHILFVQGKPVASDSPEKLAFTREGDVTTVKFESGEIYRIPDAFIAGG